MAQLYIANTTQQFHDFTYTVPERRSTITQRIDPGGQIRISANNSHLTPMDIEAIYEQHKPYGLVEMAEVGVKSNEGMLCPLVASVDKPVNISKVIEQIRRNRTVLIAMGKQTRESAAIALNNQIEENLVQMQSPDVLQKVEFSVEEEHRSRVRERSRNDEALAQQLDEQPVVAEGVRVPSRGYEEPGDARRGSRARPRRGA